MEKETKIIGTIAIWLIALINFTLAVHAITRRTAEEIEKIEKAKAFITEQKVAACIEAGKSPEFFNGNFQDCK